MRISPIKQIYIKIAEVEQKLKSLRTGYDRQNLLNVISRHSVIAWAHINLLGEYDFSDAKLRDSMGILPIKRVA